MKACEDYLRQLNISKDKNIVIGCSFGPDSMCLLMLLYKMDYKIICAHVNHKIRKESDDEFESLKKFCSEKGIPFEGLTLEKGSFNESYYRKKRYDFYRKIAEKYNTKFIMTAHHGDDLIETILMRISRGSTLKGYRGFDKCYEERGFIFIKPLIYVTKDEIEKYNLKNDIPFAIDKTNETDEYTRNRYRKYVLKELKNEVQNLHLKYLQYSEEISEAAEFIEKLACQKIKEISCDEYIILSEFLQLDKYLQKTIIKKILSDTYENDIDRINKYHVEDILNHLSTVKNFEISLPLDIKCVREYDKLYFKKTQCVENYMLTVDGDVILPNGDFIQIVGEDNSSGNYVTRLNSYELNLPLYVRNRREGDKIQIKNLNGSKKVKSIFIDEKVGKEERNDWPIVVDSKNETIWIPGIRKSKFDKTKDEKYDIILKYVKKGKRNESKEEQ